MTGWTSTCFRGGLSALWYSGAARACARITAGKGAILMLHRVQPVRRARAFTPNARLCITPHYLAALVESFREAEIDIVDLDEVVRRVVQPDRTRRFVCFTFDDGYRDNLEHALPVFQRQGAPFTVYATTGFAERSFAPWWCVLEHVLERASRVRLRAGEGGQERIYGAGDRAAKMRAFHALSGELSRLPVAAVRVQLQRLAEDHGVSLRDIAEREMCSMAELRALQNGGATIGCHSVSHPVLRHESLESARAELVDARARLEAELGSSVRHLAYPYGLPEHVGAREFTLARELGFASATTTRRGALYAAHRRHLHALPRVEVTPSFASSPHYLQAIVSGLPLVLRNRGRFAVVD